MSAEEYFTLGRVPNSAFHEKRGYLGVCACVLRAGMVAKAGEETLETLALVMVLAQSFVLLGTVVYVQRELKLTFDERGRRRQ